MDAIFAGCHKKNPEYYNQLGCSRNSTLEQITAEYRVRVRNCHPDKVGDAGNSSFVSLQKAFETLSNPQRRSVYDMWLDSPLQLEFEDFLKNSQALKMSMHWITPKETPQITIPVDEVSTPKTQWNDSRYESDAVRKFRKYEI